MSDACKKCSGTGMYQSAVVNGWVTCEDCMGYGYHIFRKGVGGAAGVGKDVSGPRPPSPTALFTLVCVACGAFLLPTAFTGSGLPPYIGGAGIGFALSLLLPRDFRIMINTRLQKIVRIGLLVGAAVAAVWLFSAGGQ